MERGLKIAIVVFLVFLILLFPTIQYNFVVKPELSPGEEPGLIDIICFPIKLGWECLTCLRVPSRGVEYSCTIESKSIEPIYDNDCCDLAGEIVYGGPEQRTCLALCNIYRQGEVCDECDPALVNLALEDCANFGVACPN